MNQIKKRGLSLLLTCGMMMGMTSAFAAVSDDTLKAALTDTAKFMYETVKEPVVGSVGGEWAVIGLARSGYEVPEKYYQDYYTTVENYVKECQGVLHNKKYTEYSRVIVALSSIGMDARNVAGYDLTMPLGDYDKTIWQGLNGPIWALIALDTRNYPMPVCTTAETQATRQMYVDRILDCQLTDGGWSLTGGTAAALPADSVSDPDITGMALQALAKYQDQPEVKKATDEALDCMSKKQDRDGGYSTYGDATVESTVQMIVGLYELGISLDDPRFVKDGNTMLDALMGYYKPGQGFEHVLGQGVNQMATEQCLYALDSVLRAREGKNSLYRMSDSLTITGLSPVLPGTGLEGKNPNVNPQPVTVPGKTFADVAGHASQTAIDALAARGIINGKGDGSVFDPDANMTRSEFAAIVVRALGLAEKPGKAFPDVANDAWYASVVGTASAYEIINGKGDGSFAPLDLITRQEAAKMVTVAAGLCGMKTEMEPIAIRDALAAFGDYVKTPEWSRPYLAFCYSQKILDDSVMDIKAEEAVTRAEIAQMLYNMLGSANLL